jgi:glutamyl-tRNA reductase
VAVLALGVSHRAASVELLERLAVTAEDAPKAYRRLLDLEGVSEGVILSTCNRVEVYAEVASYHSGFLALKRFLSETGEMDPEAFAEPLYAQYEDQAAEHLFAVAAGMDSMVLGEPQVLSQVRAAVRQAQAEGATGPVLEPLFRAAVRAGRRVRAETAIGSAPEALVAAGLDLAAASLGGVEGRAATVVGAGEMAALAVRVLRERGASRVRIVNRTPERARRLAERHQAEAHELHALERALAGAEIVVACTGAAGFVVRAQDVAGARAVEGSADGGAERAMFVLDLAVPRDVEPDVASLPGVTLANVDDLGAGIRRGPRARASIEAGAAILAEEVARFAARRQAVRLAPLIHALRARAEGIRAEEVARATGRLSDLTAEERAALEALTRAIVAKLLHDPIVRAKAQAGSTAGDLHAQVLADLFGLEFRPGP